MPYLVNCCRQSRFFLCVFFFLLFGHHVDASLHYIDTNRETQLGSQLRTANWRSVCRAQSNKSTYKMVKLFIILAPGCFFYIVYIPRWFCYKWSNSRSANNTTAQKEKIYTLACFSPNAVPRSQRGLKIGAPSTEDGDRADEQWRAGDELRHITAPIRHEPAGVPP